MGLVDYPESDSDSETERRVVHPPKKKRKTVDADADALPPLPASFLDQYSSTVRTSIQDDPSLHGGKKRVTPHVEGNWPAHVYLEWHPTPEEHDVLARLVTTKGTVRPKAAKHINPVDEVHSLLQNDLGVALPLHISLSRPLTLQTENKDDFLRRLERSIAERGIKEVKATPAELVWHPNELKSRHFLVLRVLESEELSSLLELCNTVAKEFGQPLLYAETGTPKDDEFHISIAWSLRPPPRASDDHGSDAAESDTNLDDTLSHLLPSAIMFKQVKVRIGQEVSIIGLWARR